MHLVLEGSLRPRVVVYVQETSWGPPSNRSTFLLTLCLAQGLASFIWIEMVIHSNSTQKMP